MASETKQTTQQVEAIMYDANPDGLVLWCSDWIAAFEMTHKGQGGFYTKSYGPATYGHVDLYVSR